MVFFKQMLKGAPKKANDGDWIRLAQLGLNQSKDLLIRYALRPSAVVIRTHQIGLVLSMHGFAGILTSLGLEWGKRGLIAIGVTRGKKIRMDAVFGRNLARTLMELGPTFIKLGQMLATRSDFVGEPVAEELRVLFDRVRPLSYRRWRKILDRELGRKVVRQAFKSIESTPLASASLSQVHKAVLSDGRSVIIKLQKPGLDAEVRTDLLILGGIASTLHTVYPELQLPLIFEDFRKATESELDYRIEATNIDRFTKNYQKLLGKPDVIFPRYYPEWLTQHVIVLDPMRGKKVSELPAGSTVARGAAELSLQAIFEQIFEHGFFHADPHAGNLFYIEEEGRMGCIDLGLVGALEPEDKQKFLKLLFAVLKKDRATLARRLYELGTPSPGTRMDLFEAEVNALIDKMASGGISNVRLEPAINELLLIARRNSIHIPNRYVMMMRSCLMVDGLARNLNPKINVAQVATPIVARSLVRALSPFSRFRRLF